MKKVLVLLQITLVLILAGAISSISGAGLLGFIILAAGGLLVSRTVNLKNTLCIGACGLLTADIVPNCDFPMIAGTKTRLVLINKDDVLSITRNVANPLVIEAITLKTGVKKGYIWDGIKQSVQPKQAVEQKKFATVYNHEVTFIVFSGTSATKKQLELLAKGSVMAIVENNYRGSDGSGAFEVYGTEVGLTCTVLSRDLQDTDTQGAYLITLASPEEAKEAHLPNTFFITDYPTTLAAVEDVLTATAP